MLAAAAAVLLLLHRWENRPTAQTEDDPYAGEDESLTYYNGGWYARRDVETVLVMGVDKYAAQTSGDNYNQQQQADFLLLLVVDRTAGVCRVLPLNRDTMTEITALGLAGEQVGTFNGQLALSHTYGSGGLDSARQHGPRRVVPAVRRGHRPCDGLHHGCRARDQRRGGRRDGAGGGRFLRRHGPAAHGAGGHAPR